MLFFLSGGGGLYGTQKEWDGCTAITVAIAKTINSMSIIRLQATKAAMDAERDALTARLAELEIVCSAPTPVRGQPLADKLEDSEKQLSILTALQVQS